MHIVYYENSTILLEIFYLCLALKDCRNLSSDPNGWCANVIYIGSSSNQALHSHEYCYVAKQLKGMSPCVRAKFRYVTKIRNLAYDHDVGM